MFLQQRQRQSAARAQAAAVAADPALQRATNMACDILNITQSDLNDLMSFNNSAGGEGDSGMVRREGGREICKKRMLNGFHPIFTCFNVGQSKGLSGLNSV